MPVTCGEAGRKKAESEISNEGVLLVSDFTGFPILVDGVHGKCCPIDSYVHSLLTSTATKLSSVIRSILLNTILLQ